METKPRPTSLRNILKNQRRKYNLNTPKTIKPQEINTIKEPQETTFQCPKGAIVFFYALVLSESVTEATRNYQKSPNCFLKKL